MEFSSFFDNLYTSTKYTQSNSETVTVYIIKYINEKLYNFFELNQSLGSYSTNME